MTSSPPPTPNTNTNLHSPQTSDSEASSLHNNKLRRPARSPLASYSHSDLPSSNSRNNASTSASLSNLFASTTSLPGRGVGSRGSGTRSGAVTPPISHPAGTNASADMHGSPFSPPGSTLAPTSQPSTPQTSRTHNPTSHPTSPSSDSNIRTLLLRSQAPHISILASADTEELIRHKGLHGGLLELLRPFGDAVVGKVTIRDSGGASRSWEDFGVRFVGVGDGLEAARGSPSVVAGRREEIDGRREGMVNGMGDGGGSGSEGEKRRSGVLEYKPQRLRTGGDLAQIEELVERHLVFAEERQQQQGRTEHNKSTDSTAEEDRGETPEDYLNHNTDPHNPHAQPPTPADESAPSPFYTLYLRRLLSAAPLTPPSTLPHPTASLIAISSRSSSPIEDLRTLYASSNMGDHRLPHWVHNEFLRYYLLVHDEDFDDLGKSVALFEQMKRHFGLHCHLLRLRSRQCPAVGDGGQEGQEGKEVVGEEAEETVELPTPTWTSAAEELAEISIYSAQHSSALHNNNDTNENDDSDDSDIELPPPEISHPRIYATDATNIRAFVREMVTQSLIPSMERASANWNENVASRRRGLSGRFMTLSKRWTSTAFGSGRSASAAAPAMNGSPAGVAGGTGQSYDPVVGIYPPAPPEATLRRLADYAVMLRDYKLARATYELVQGDFKSEKAWRYWGTCCELSALTTLVLATPASSASPPSSSSGVAAGSGAKALVGGRNGSPAATASTAILPSSAVNAATPGLENLDSNLEAAYTTPLTRLPKPQPYLAARALLPAIELLILLRTPKSLQQAADWAQRILEDRVLGPVGAVLLTERLAAAFAVPRRGVDGDVRGKGRKSAFWNLLACEGWVRLEMPVRAGEALNRAERGFAALGLGEESGGMRGFLGRIGDIVQVLGEGIGRVDGEALLEKAEKGVDGAEATKQAEDIAARQVVASTGGGGRNLAHMQQAVSALASFPSKDAPAQTSYAADSTPSFAHRKTQSLNPPPNDFLHMPREQPPTAANQTLRSYSPSPSRSPLAAPGPPAQNRLEAQALSSQFSEQPQAMQPPMSAPGSNSNPASASFDPLGARQDIEAVPFAPAPTPAQVLRRERGHGRAVSAAASTSTPTPAASGAEAAGLQSVELGTSGSDVAGKQAEGTASLGGEEEREISVGSAGLRKPDAGGHEERS